MLKRRLKEPFGKAGLTVAIFALVFALVGGAYAANNLGATASKAKAGPRGKTGKTGPAGPQGPAGPAGPAGPKGDTGAAGSNGAPGANGKSVTVSEIEEGDPGECEETGGALVTPEGGTGVEVCNGEEGPPGAIHPGETLPKGASETGVWAYGPGPKPAVVPLSFNIPLASGPTPRTIEEGEAPTEECPGTVEHPQAKEGFFCLYVESIEVPEGAHQPTLAIGTVSTGLTGLVLRIFAPEDPSVLSNGAGSWAVTAG